MKCVARESSALFGLGTYDGRDTSLAHFGESVKIFGTWSYDLREFT